MTADGRVVIGFSKPHYALYSISGTTVTYASGAVLARGVSVSLEIETSEDNNFYADNGPAETDNGSFVSGTGTLTVDGLNPDARRAVLGLPEADSSGWTGYGDGISVPFVGVGYIVKYRSGGDDIYVPTVLPKVKFTLPAKSAETQGENINWQTEDLPMTVYKDGTADNNWLYEGADFTTEAAALAALKTKLGIQ